MERLSTPTEQKEFLDELLEDRQEAYKHAISSAREYYESCNALGIEPEKDLQKVVYDLGGRVRDAGKKNRIRKIREINSIIESREMAGKYPNSISLKR